ncbi:MAG: hypothetical protein ABWZ66_05940, partial [Pyrinomonadaceae bacterium]
MRSNNHNIRQRRQGVEKVLLLLQKAKNIFSLGMEGKQWLVCIMICAMLLPVFSLPVSASTYRTNSSKFEPVNEKLSVWTETWRNLNAQIESWTTPLRSGNALIGENNDDKKKKVEKDIDKSNEDVKKIEQNQIPPETNAGSSDREKTPAENETLNTNNLVKRVKKIETRFPKDITIQVGQTIALAALALDEKGKVVNGININWDSGNNEVLNIQVNQASAIKKGFANLTVKAGNISKTFNVKIEESLSNASLTSAFFLDDADEFRSYFNPQNNLGSPIGQVEAQASNQAVAMRNTLERPGSSNFSFGVPVASLPGRGIDAGINLTYNSRVWNYWQSPIGGSSSRYRYNLDGNWLAPGFNLSLGKLTRLAAPNTSTSYNFTSPDGTRHQLTLLSGNTFESTDGTFIKLQTSNDGSGNHFGVLTYSDGTIVNFAGSLARLFPTKITDNNGNVIEIAYKQNDTEGRILYIKDTLSRYIKFYYDSGNRLVAVTVPTFNSSSETQMIRFYYETMTFDTSLQRFTTGASPTMPNSVDVLRYVYFPGTQTGYKYDYSSGYGMIYKVSDLRGIQVNSALMTETGSVINDGIVAASTTYNYPLTVTTPLSDVPNYTTRTDEWKDGATTRSAVTTYQV